MAIAKSAAKSGKKLPKTGSIRRKTGANEQASISHPRLSFPVVVIGASVGGLSAFVTLLKALTSKSGMAFVLIKHLETNREGALSSLLSKATRMPVIEVSDGTPLEPNHVYIIPPNKSMTIRGGALRLTTQSDTSWQQHPIDNFSVALAEEQRNASIGVVLSGTGSDGTHGLKAIKAAGGLTFAQDPKTAHAPDMPMSAIMAGSVDFVLSPKRIAAELARIGRVPHLSEAREAPEGDDLEKICLIILSSVGIDFRLYRQSMLRRRMARRMAIQKIPSLQRYAQVLRENPTEIQTLVDEIFRHVTGFFRDPESYRALLRRVLMRLELKSRAGHPIRIWVPGCSTGEEVYSIVMLLLERLGERKEQITIQIFGTDIQKHAVEFARNGTYTGAAVADISSSRLERFFVKVDDGYQVQKFVREICVFARRDVAMDPPFSRLDLISCRNVLTHMDGAQQKKVLRTFQSALNSGGFLFLGNSESIRSCSEAFTVEDQKHRIFLRKPTAIPPRKFQLPIGQGTQSNATASHSFSPGSTIDLGEETNRILLERYAPPAVVIDADFRVVRFQGNTSPYFTYAGGRPSFHLLKIVRPEIAAELRTAVYQASRECVTVRRDSVPFDNDGHAAAVRLEVVPLQKHIGRRRDLLVVFREIEFAPFNERRESGGTGAGRTHQKKDEVLASTREHSQGLSTQHETAQGQMMAAEEEITLSNEELETAGQELQPVELALSSIETEGSKPGVAFLSDTTQPRQLQQAAKTQMEADLAKEKLETVGMLAEGIAHDFNNLLAAVLAHAELAKAQLAEGTNPNEELQRIETMVLHGTEIVRQLMTYAGQETEAFEVVSISAIIEDLLALLKVSAPKHVRVQFDPCKDIPAVRANSTQIRQVVMNLFSNASDAIGDRNGVIRMRAGQAKVGPDSSLATVEGLAVGDYVKLEVSDTGHGMTPEVQARIFDPLFTTKATGSHGHGLVVVKRIVDYLHGSISVSSAPGRGTTFQILLPCETHEVQAIPALVARSPLNELESQATILVVEDEELLREAVSKILRKNGFAVLEVNDGSAALEMIRRLKTHIDVLLLDITLPGASSRQVYEEAKRLKPDLAVIVTSAKSKETAGASLATGIEHFLRKPFSTVELIAMVHRLVSSRARVAAN